ncbi:MAG: DUF1616 domain-containing protein [Candidatus Woesearchaeota archaeon]
MDNENMTLQSILQTILGLLLALFIPGYLIARIYFKELNELEKFVLGFVLSICIDIFIGLFLGYNETMKNITGGITTYNLWLYLGIISGVLIIAYIILNREEIRIIWDYFFRKSDNNFTKKFAKK